MILISANNRILDIISSNDFDLVNLPEDLVGIIDQGFLAEDDCIFLRSLYVLDRNVKKLDFPDSTGYECFVNHIHIDDYVDDNYLKYSFSFVEKLFSMWRHFDGNKTIRAIISCDDFGAVVRFHILRDDETWINDDLECSIQPVLYIDSHHAVKELANPHKERKRGSESEGTPQNC